MIFNMTGGSKKPENPLNFEIVGGTSQPSNPKENTIWVNTSTTISSWVFSADEPTGESGKVWLKVGASSSASFNALKQETLMIYPMYAKQYISRSWEAVEAKIYKNGKWIDWNIYIFKTGQGAVVPLYTSLETSKVLATINSEIIIVDATSSSECMSRVGTEEPIDITNYKSLCIEVQTTYRGVSNSAIMEKQKFVFGVSKEKLGWGDGENSKYAASQFVDDNSASQKYTLDISALTGEYYASFGGFIDANVDNWWLE